MAYILHHSTGFHGSDSGYQKITENGVSPVGHGHSHGLLGSHGNTSVRAAFIHVLGDLLQSFGVLIAAIVIYLRVNTLKSLTYRPHTVACLGKINNGVFFFSVWPEFVHP